MNGYLVVVFESDGNRLFQRGRCQLSNQCVPYWTHTNEDMLPLIEMALHGLQETEGPKKRCNLEGMSMIDPVPLNGDGLPPTVW